MSLIFGNVFTQTNMLVTACAICAGLMVVGIAAAQDYFKRMPHIDPNVGDE